MTQQFPDFCIFQGRAWQIKGIGGPPLPKPSDFGMTTSPPFSACWRGYIRVFSISDDQLVLDTLFVDTADPKPIGGATPYLGDPKDMKQAAEDLPQLSGGQSIFANFKKGKVQFSHDVLGVVIDGFSTIYKDLDYKLFFNGKILLQNERSNFEWFLYALRRGRVDGDEHYAGYWPDQDPRNLLYESLLENGLLDEKMKNLFDVHDSINKDLLDEIERLLDSHSILLNFQDGVLAHQSELSIREMKEEYSEMRKMFFFEYQ
jgi:hypothetical protein